MIKFLFRFQLNKEYHINKFIDKNIINNYELINKRSKKYFKTYHLRIIILGL